MFCSRCGTEATSTTKFCPTCGLDLSALTTGVGGQGAQGATARMAAAPPEQDETSLIREALKDEYDLEKELGRGGMAVVYKGRDKQLEREVAIKVLPFSLSFDAEFVERFQREARTAGKLEHPNIIPIYRVGKSGRVIYFVMKFIRGKSLSSVIESRGAIPVPEAKRFLIESARALGYAHKHGIVHRDIKPDNIMFDELGQAIVADFGIAKAQSGAKLTGTGMSIGTPHYMSPEQARAQNLDGRSDIYSLGVVAYQALTGHVPFDGEDSFSIGYKHIMEELPTPALDTAEQRELFTVVQKMMAKKPEDRFQTAEELIAALEGGSAVSAMSMADMSTMPTRAIEPMKAPTSKGGPPAMAGQATAPLPRASASMGKPAEAGAGGGGPPSKRPMGGKPPAESKSKAPVFIAAGLGVVLLGGAGYFFGVMKPQQAAAKARADSTAAVARRDSIRRDSIRTDSIRLAAAANDTSKTPGTSRTPATPTAPPGTLRLTGLPASARATFNNRAVPANGSVASGTHPLVVEAPGFQRYSVALTVPAGGTLSHAVTMVPVPPAGPPGTLRLTGVPAGARVTWGGRALTGVTGGKDIASGTQTLVVEATGFQRYEARVTLAPRGSITHDVRLVAAPTTATGTVDCTRYQVGLQNPNNACYDSRPAPQSVPTLALPADCPATGTRSATIVVRVSASGDVTGSPLVYGRSGCQAFDNAAQAQALDIRFTPARKGGAAVDAWYAVPFQPRRQ